MDIDAYVLALRVINPRNKTGMIRLVADMVKDNPNVDIEEVIAKLYPEERYKRR